MHKDLTELVKNQRKFKRELLELRELRSKVMTHKNPDPKTLKLIDDEIAKYMNGGAAA